GSHPRFNETSNRPFAMRRHRLDHNSLLLALDIALQPTDCLVPILPHELKIPPHTSKSRLLQLPDALAAPSRAADQTCVLHDAQMLRDRLPRDGKPGTQVRDRHRPAVAEPGYQAESRLIAQRREDGRRTREGSGRKSTTRSGQDVSLAASPPSSNHPGSP